MHIPATKTTKALVLALSLTLFTSASRSQGIPVIDLQQLLQAIQQVMQGLEELENQITQIQQLDDQIDQMETQVKSMTGSRALGLILNDKDLQNYVPSNVTTIVKNVDSRGYASLTATAKSLRDARMVYNCADLSGQARTDCQAQLGQPYQAKAIMMDALEAAKGRIGQIEGLMNQINATQDPKAVAEIQARLDAENALLQHEQAQINMARGMSEAERAVAESRAREAQLQQTSRTGRLSDYVPR
ncbi:type IV secretion system protein [Ideonella sp. DXS29W]|uniref:Type IV secretion system protein n=1 Tax=Ideonella lacteola TaxID=2984193 RepID=A0ABU9BWL2_9BURK